MQDVFDTQRVKVIMYMQENKGRCVESKTYKRPWEGRKIRRPVDRNRLKAAASEHTCLTYSKGWCELVGIGGILKGTPRGWPYEQ